jgi:hypothetical protein
MSFIKDLAKKSTDETTINTITTRTAVVGYFAL